MTAPVLAPVDPELAAQVADADRERAVRFIRKRLAEVGMSPSARRMLEHDLRQLERPPGNVTPIR